MARSFYLWTPLNVQNSSQIGQRLAGLVILVVCGWFTVQSWYTARNEGYYYRKAVAFLPAFAVLGLGMLLFPIDRERLRAEHGTDKPLTIADYPLSWKILAGVAVAAGVANWVAIAHV